MRSRSSVRPRPAVAGRRGSPISSSTWERSPLNSRQGRILAPSRRRAQDDAQGLERPCRPRRAVSVGIVAARGAGADQDRLALGAQDVGVAARLLAGDPLTRAVGHGDDAVERARDLQHDVRAARHAVPYIWRELCAHGVLLDADLDVDARTPSVTPRRRPRRAGPGRSCPR